LAQADQEGHEQQRPMLPASFPHPRKAGRYEDRARSFHGCTTSIGVRLLDELTPASCVSTGDCLVDLARIGRRSRSWRWHDAELSQGIEVVDDAALPLDLSVTNLENHDLLELHALGSSPSSSASSTSSP